MKGYKGFNSDLTCLGFQYEVGKTYHQDGDLQVCSNGFHFCKNLTDCFEFYDKFDSRFCEVEALSDCEQKMNKFATLDIKIVRELSRKEINKVIYGSGYGSGYGYGDGSGYLESGCFNEDSRDRTKWYTNGRKGRSYDFSCK